MTQTLIHIYNDINIFIYLHIYFFPPLTSVCSMVSISLNCSNHVTARSILLWSDVSGNVKRLYYCKPIITVCSNNVNKQNVCNVSSASKIVKPLTVCKFLCSTIPSKGNVCNVSIVSQHLKPLNFSTSMSPCKSKCLYRIWY